MSDAVISDKSERTWAMLCHLSGLLFWIGVPFANIAGPLIIWLSKKDDMPLVDSHGKEALNFQISFTIYLIAAGILCILLIGLPMLLVLLFAQFVLVLIAALKTNQGEDYRYPLTLRFLT
jgi:uncharacterized Tic20 family protein